MNVFELLTENDNLENKPTICFARIRASEKYAPLHSIVDCWLYSIKKFMENNPQYHYTLYGISFTQNRPKKNIESIEKADIVVIPSEAEWTFQIKGFVMNFMVQRTNKFLDEIRNVVDGKKIVILSTDRADNERLYRERVFPNKDVEIAKIDEDDFKGGFVGAVRYHFMKMYDPIQKDRKNFEKEYDFAYWGTTKKKTVDYENEEHRGKESGDIRHIVLKELYKSDEISTVFIGAVQGVKNIKWSKVITDITPHIAKARAVVCFNWLEEGKTALTARYNEALAYDVIPLVNYQYDTTNRLVADEWQRIRNSEDIIEKCKQLRDEDFRQKMLAKIKEKYAENTDTLEDYVEEFDRKLKVEIMMGLEQYIT